MVEPNPNLNTKSPIQILSSKNIFPEEQVRHRKSPSIVKLDSGRLLLIFSLTEDHGRLKSSVVLTESDDNGHTWSEPRVVYEKAGWTCINMGGMSRLSNEMIRLIIGRVKLDFSLGGDEPFSDWYTGFIDSYDDGKTWTTPGAELKLFPMWTEVYGQSNPHLLSDGRYLMATMGTMGRDLQWHAGVSFCDPKNDYSFSKPVIIANDPERNYSDIDVARLKDGRFLAVVREHNIKRSVFSHSEDEGKTWTPIRYTGFLGANIKLQKLRSGAVICVYRDENPEMRGVSVSVTENGGETWNHVGQLYSAPSDAAHVPSLLCGYPDMVYINDTDLIGVLHTYPDISGRMDLHQFHIRDVSSK